MKAIKRKRDRKKKLWIFDVIPDGGDGLVELVEAVVERQLHVLSPVIRRHSPVSAVIH